MKSFATTIILLIATLTMSTSAIAMPVERLCEQDLNTLDSKPGFYLGVPVATIDNNTRFGQHKFKHTAVFVDDEDIYGVSGVLQNLNHTIRVDKRLRRAFGPPEEALWGWYWPGLAEIRRFESVHVVSINCDAFDQGL